MPIEVTLNRKKDFVSNHKNHAEEVMFATDPAGSLEVEMNGWPCVNEGRHDCHGLFVNKSAGRTITVTITEDHGGYAASHGQAFGSTGTITYADGNVTYS